jgi:hypothetical protein
MVDFIGVSEAISALVWSIVDIHSAGSKCFELQLRSQQLRATDERDRRRRAG